MSEDYLADSMDLEKALYAFISQHAKDLPLYRRMVLQKARAELLEEIEAEGQKIARRVRAGV